MALETERTRYEELKEELLKHNEGKFALIVGYDLLGIFDGPETAYSKGIQARGNVPMLIQLITRQEKVETIPAMVLGLMNAHL